MLAGLAALNTMPFCFVDMPSINLKPIALTDKQEALYQTLRSEAEATLQQAECTSSNITPPRSSLGAAFNELHNRLSNIMYGDPQVKWVIPCSGSNMSSAAIEITGGWNGSWWRHVGWVLQGHAFDATTLYFYKNLQPRRNGDDGRPLPLKVQFVLKGEMGAAALQDAKVAFSIMRLAKLTLYSNFQVNLLYSHALEDEVLATEIGYIKEQLVGVARATGCKLVP